MIRFATDFDAQQILDIYNEAVQNTTATFDLKTKDISYIQQQIQDHKGIYTFLVEEQNNKIVGYASLSLYRPRKAFEQTVELSVYVHAKHKGKGVGSSLFAALLEHAKKQPKIHSIVSLITGDNTASIRLHEKYGFSCCGELKEVGHKFGKDLDLKFYQLLL